MASTSTGMLLLGAVQLFEPVNGYQIRRELVSWRVDEWAHIKPGVDLLRAGVRYWRKPPSTLPALWLEPAPCGTDSLGCTTT